MSSRPKAPKKQPTRGARKGKKRPQKPKEPPPLKPIKIIGCQLVGARYNEKGEQIGEHLMSGSIGPEGEWIPEPFTIWAPDFPNLKKIVDRGVAEARERERQAGNPEG